MAGPVKGKTTLDRTCHMKGMVGKMGRGQTQCTLFFKNNCLDNGVHFTDAIITKPGGVTITECLWKKLPIFIYEALPGQEEFNLHYLKNEGLIFHLDNRHPLNSVEDIIIHTLKKDLLTFKKRLDTFYNDLEKSDISTIIGKILVP